MAKHYNHLQLLFQQRGTSINVDKIIAEDFQHDVPTTPLTRHFQEIIGSAVLDLDGQGNIFYAPAFISSLAKYALPHATLWSGMMLGDLGRHGTGPVYQHLSKLYNKVRQSKKQNFTQDNQTQGIMEKSQWDLKKIRFQRRRVTRLDDFVQTYQKMHDALVLEHADTERCRKKSFKVDMEVWRKSRRDRKRKGFYVSPLDLSLKTTTSLPKTWPNLNLQDEEPAVIQTQDSEEIIQTSAQTTSTLTEQQDKKDTFNDALSQLKALWEKDETEVVVSVIPSQIKGNSFLVHHSELLSLKPHNWLAGETIECLLHQTVTALHLEKTVYIMNHYTSSVILFKDRTTVRRQSLSKVKFNDYMAIISFFNVDLNHWKLLVGVV